MALLRLGFLALAACARAGAQPSVASGLKVPPGWQVLPELATSVGEATKTEGVMVDGVEAWGETARGCYAVWFVLHGTHASAEAVLAGLASAQLVTSNVVTPESGAGLVAATFTRPPYTGRLRARASDGTITAMACFANEREPVSCESGCTTLLGAIP